MIYRTHLTGTQMLLTGTKYFPVTQAVTKCKSFPSPIVAISPSRHLIARAPPVTFRSPSTLICKVLHRTERNMFCFIFKGHFNKFKIQFVFNNNSVKKLLERYRK